MPECLVCSAPATHRHRKDFDVIDLCCLHAHARRVALRTAGLFGAPATRIPHSPLCECPSS